MDALLGALRGTGCGPDRRTGPHPSGPTLGSAVLLAGLLALGAGRTAPGRWQLGSLERGLARLVERNRALRLADVVIVAAAARRAHRLLRVGSRAPMPSLAARSGACSAGPAGSPLPPRRQGRQLRLSTRESRVIFMRGRSTTSSRSRVSGRAGCRRAGRRAGESLPAGDLAANRPAAAPAGGESRPSTAASGASTAPPGGRRHRLPQRRGRDPRQLDADRRRVIRLPAHGVRHRRRRRPLEPIGPSSR